VFKEPRKIAVVVAAVVVVGGGAVLGRHLLSGTAGSTASSTAAVSNTGAHGGGSTSGPPSAARALQGIEATPTTGAKSAAVSGAASASSAGSPGGTGNSSSTGSGATLPRVPVSAIEPQIVRTATMDLRVGKDSLSSALTTIATLAATDGGYVESSSMGGGTARTSPVSGNVVFTVLDSDFSGAMTTLSAYGKVTNQEIQGKDVTNQVSSNAATIEILQDQVNLLQGKLAQTTDINTFLQIQDQLFPVEQQLQQLENQQTVLENSAALATITANLSAPGAPLVSAAPAQPHADSATVAWRYLRHNSLAVLDGLAVGGGWILPVLALVALAWLVYTRIARRRRQAITPA
jgi:Domain of unknown function (DUF4349)